MAKKNPHAMALGKLGGKARAKKTTPEQRKKWAAKGGKARAERHTKAEFTEWAKRGGRPRKKWSELSPAGKLQRKYRQAKKAAEKKSGTGGN